MRTLALLSSVALCLAVSLGCSTIEVSYDYDSDANFGAYRTYAWLSEPPKLTGDARAALERNSLLDKRIKTAVNEQMPGKGLTLTDDSPDLLVVYHTGVEDQVQVTDWGYGYGGPYRRPYGRGYGPRDVSVTKYRLGTLILDFVDASTQVMVFRATARKVLASDPTPQQIEETLNAAVTKMLEEYPPRRAD